MGLVVIFGCFVWIFGVFIECEMFKNEVSRLFSLGFIFVVFLMLEV